ncbi:hypothetical protein ACQWF0_24660, partial [Salmonella enterica subsp. enterica serovar Infantis]
KYSKNAQKNTKRKKQPTIRRPHYNLRTLTNLKPTITKKKVTKKPHKTQKRKKQNHSNFNCDNKKKSPLIKKNEYTADYLKTKNPIKQ